MPSKVIIQGWRPVARYFVREHGDIIFLMQKIGKSGEPVKRWARLEFIAAGSSWYSKRWKPCDEHGKYVMIYR